MIWGITSQRSVALHKVLRPNTAHPLTILTKLRMFNHVCMQTCIYLFVCMYVHVCYVFYVFIYAYVCMYVCMYFFIYCMHMCVCVCACALIPKMTDLRGRLGRLPPSTHVANPRDALCMCVHMYVTYVATCQKMWANVYMHANRAWSRLYVYTLFTYICVREHLCKCFHVCWPSWLPVYVYACPCMHTHMHAYNYK